MKISAGLVSILSLASCSPLVSPSHTPKVAELVRSLPAHRFEAPAYQKLVLSDGTPRPANLQEQYLTMPEYALDPERHFLKLDDHHLLIHSEVLQIADGTPAQLEILRKNPDASWSDITREAAPAWAHNPRNVTFSADFTHITITGNADERQTFIWATHALTPCP